MTPLCNIGDIPIDAKIFADRYKTLIKYGYRYTQNVLFKQGEMPWYRWIFLRIWNNKRRLFWTILVTEIKTVNLAHWKVPNKYARNQPWNNTYSMYGSVYNLFKSLLENFSSMSSMIVKESTLSCTYMGWFSFCASFCIWVRW